MLSRWPARMTVMVLLSSSLAWAASAPQSPPSRVTPRPAPAPARPSAPPAAAVPADDIAILDRFSAALNRVARTARPSVVSVQTVTGGPAGRRVQASGSGVIFDARGHVVTSHHVIQGASRINVMLADGREFQAELLGADPKTDVAVLRTGATRVAPARFGDSSRVDVGQLVLAIGSPFRLSQTVSHGIVSATGRADLDIDGMEYQNFIQTDAPTNPGNSGGALVNARGEVIGINTAIASGSGQFAGVAFATPSNTVVWAARRIISGQPLVRGYLGIAMRPLLPDVAEWAGLLDTDGVVIERVTPNSPAARAGLRAGDIVLQIGSARVIAGAQLRSLIAETPPGSRVIVTTWREGQRVGIEVTLGQQPRES